MKGRGRERERNINVREKHQSVASCNGPNWGQTLHPRHLPSVGIEPVTFWFVGWYSDILSHTSQGCLLFHLFVFWCMIYTFLFLYMPHMFTFVGHFRRYNLAILGPGPSPSRVVIVIFCYFLVIGWIISVKYLLPTRVQPLMLLLRKMQHWVCPQLP